MKVKLDENLGNRAAALFGDFGHQVMTVSEQDLQGTNDDDLIDACRAEERVLVTLDLDFSNVLRFPPERYAGIGVLRLPHPVKLETIRERVQFATGIGGTRRLRSALNRGARPHTPV